MRLVFFFNLIVVSFAFAESDFAKAEGADLASAERSESRVLAQVKNYKKGKKFSFKKKPRKTTYKSIRSAKYRGYKVAEIPQYEVPAFFTREDMNKILPSSVNEKDRSGDVLQKMGDKAINVWLKSSTMQKMSIVQAAQKVENAMKAEVNLAPEDSLIKHKLNFQVQALQTTSKIDYTGYVDASVTYNVRDNKAAYEVRKKVLQNKDLFVNHTDAKNENLSSVGLKWSF